MDINLIKGLSYYDKGNIKKGIHYLLKSDSIYDVGENLNL
ncbi:MAG: hypothetical protein ACJA1Z_000232 [Patiriisocius sp.]|jgi:hypothetical protein